MDSLYHGSPLCDCALETCTTGKMRYFHPERRPHVIENRLHRFTAAIETTTFNLLHFMFLHLLTFDSKAHLTQPFP